MYFFKHRLDTVHMIDVESCILENMGAAECVMCFVCEK